MHPDFFPNICFVSFWQYMVLSAHDIFALCLEYHAWTCLWQRQFKRSNHSFPYGLSYDFNFDVKDNWDSLPLLTLGHNFSYSFHSVWAHLWIHASILIKRSWSKKKISLRIMSMEKTLLPCLKNCSRSLVLTKWMHENAVAIQAFDNPFVESFILPSQPFFHFFLLLRQQLRKAWSLSRYISTPLGLYQSNLLILLCCLSKKRRKKGSH